MQHHISGTLFTIAAPSGAGKTSLVRELVQQIPDILVSVSHTTRPIREGEVEGIHYHFIDKKQFKQMIKENDFLEHATVFNNFYGTSKKWVEGTLASGKDVILEIDWQGAQQIRRLFANCINIFILPPAKAELLKRLQARAQDDEMIIHQRMALSGQEISHYKEFDYLIVNDDFTAALQDLRAVVLAQRVLRSRQETRYAKLLHELVDH